ncbi:MAG: glycosyltransferase family 2 protein, partial [candidate division WOR-3 bacterium]
MVSIIIVNYNSAPELRNCLTNIKALNLNCPFEIIIVDNASVQRLDYLINYFKIYLKVRLIKNYQNVGYARAVNKGIKTAKGKYILIINPDIIITPGAIENMISFMEQQKDIGILAPRLLNFDNTIQYSCFRFPRIWTPIIRRSFLKILSFGKKEIVRYLMLDYDHEAIKEVDWVLGAAIMTRYELIKRVGMMDERFFLYFEDVDWCRRFQMHGFKIVYFPQAIFYHKYSRLSNKRSMISSLFNKYLWHHLISCVKYFAKWCH